MELTRDTMDMLFRFSTDGVCAAERGTVFYANPAAEKLFGRDVTGEEAQRLFPLEELAPDTEILSSLLRLSGRDFPFTARRSGAVILITVAAAPEEREPVPPAVMQQLRSAVFSLRISLERLVSKSGKKAQPYGEAAVHSYYALLRQVRHLTELQEIRAGDMLLRPKMLELRGLTEELLDSVRALLGEQGAELRLIAPEELPLWGDGEKITEMILTLLLNSLQHTPEHGTVTLELRRKGKYALLSVDDDGEGIDTDKLSGLFSPGGVADTGSVGAGLGLSVAQGIARAHGGTLLAEKRKGRGARVCVKLPLTDELILRDHVPYRVSGADILLTELAPILKNGAYSAKFRD